MQNPAQAAVFIDAENHPDLDVSALMQQLKFLNVVEQRAYADWRRRRLDRVAEQLSAAGFEMHYTRSGHHPGDQKDTADGFMERDILRVLSSHSEITVVVIVSGDKFFSRLVYLLRQQGRQVIVAADPHRIGKALYRAADRYLPLGNLAQRIRALDRLERSNRYLTFSFTVQRLGIEKQDLARLLGEGLLIQKVVSRPGRGDRPEISLNRQALIVRAILGTW